MKQSNHLTQRWILPISVMRLTKMQIRPRASSMFHWLQMKLLWVMALCVWNTVHIMLNPGADMPKLNIFFLVQKYTTGLHGTASVSGITMRYHRVLLAESIFVLNYMKSVMYLIQPRVRAKWNFIIRSITYLIILPVGMRSKCHWLMVVVILILMSGTARLLTGPAGQVLPEMTS